MEDFHVENVAERSLEGEQNAKALIEYSWGNAFEFYYERFSEDGELSEEGKSYSNAKNILRNQFGRKEYAVCMI